MEETRDDPPASCPVHHVPLVPLRPCRACHGAPQSPPCPFCDGLGAEVECPDCDREYEVWMQEIFGEEL